ETFLIASTSDKFERKILIEREKKRKNIGTKILFDSSTLKNRNKQSFVLASLPRNSAPTHLHRRYFLTEIPRENYWNFGLSRHIFREMVNASLLPDATSLS
ncbi:hypothetical protein HN51_004918, partial [Arachis hypogaea]